MTKQELTEEVNSAFLAAAERLLEFLTPEEWDAMPDKEKLIEEAAAVYLKAHIEAAQTVAASRVINRELTENAGKE